MSSRRSTLNTRPAADQPSLEAFEHAGEDRLAIAFGGQSHDRPVGDLEVDPGAAVTLEVDQVDERRRRTRRRTESDASWHQIALN